MNECLPFVPEITKLTTDLQKAHENALASSSAKLVEQYGSSCWLKLLEPSPPPSSDSSSDEEESPSSPSSSDEEGEEVGEMNNVRTTADSQLTSEEFYQKNVALSKEEVEVVESSTRDQSKTAAWHKHRQNRVTSTAAKAIACRRKSDFTAILREKLARNTFPVR